MLVELSGSYSLNFFLESVREIAEHGKNEIFTKALVDVRNVEGVPSIPERYEIGVEISKVWSNHIQVAVVREKNLVNNLVENVAVNRGAGSFRVFMDIRLALEWLNSTDRE